MVGKSKKINVEHTAYKYRIYPTEEQKILFAKTFGCCRYLWNRMLSDHITLYREIGHVPMNTPADYKDLDECLWLNEVDSLALANVQISLDKAFASFFAGKSKYPSYKKKYAQRQSYTTNRVNTNIRLEYGTLKLPKIGKVKIYLHRKAPGNDWTLKSVTVSYESNGSYYASILYERVSVTRVTEIDEKKIIGLDMSIPHLYMDSNGNLADYKKPYRRIQERIRREHQRLSKMKRGSNNYKKQKERLARLYAKTKHQRKDTLHKLSYLLTEKYDIICIENLNMIAIIQFLNLAKSASDNGWGMFIDFLSYKQKRKGHVLIKVDRFFASSKKCSRCGYIHKGLELSDRLYICPRCGHVLDRDENAAINIREEGYRIYKKTYQII